ncbi:MAG: hypothetical protein AB1592_18930 [Pseudomonadota bacterium]
MNTSDILVLLAAAGLGWLLLRTQKPAAQPVQRWREPAFDNAALVDELMKPSNPIWYSGDGWFRRDTWTGVPIYK